MKSGLFYSVNNQIKRNTGKQSNNIGVTASSIAINDTTAVKIIITNVTNTAIKATKISITAGKIYGRKKIKTTTHKMIVNIFDDLFILTPPLPKRRTVEVDREL